MSITQHVQDTNRATEKWLETNSQQVEGLIKILLSLATDQKVLVGCDAPTMAHTFLLLSKLNRLLIACAAAKQIESPLVSLLGK